MDTKHTPGPWIINPSGSLEPESWKKRPDNGKPYREHGTIRPAAPGGCVAHVYLGDTWPENVDVALAEQEANARLISAAPCLLAAAQAVLDNAIDCGACFVDRQNADEDCPRDEDGDPWYPDFWELRQAIAKATGQ